MSAMIPAWVDGVLRPVEKLEVHRRGLRHKAVSVILLSGDAILLQRRALGKYHTPGLWTNTCCTHPLWGEAAETCARRRLAEEMGLTGIRFDRHLRTEYRAEVGGGLVEHECVDVFTAQVRDRLEPRPDPEEVMETAWLDLALCRARIAETPEVFTPWFRIYLETCGTAFEPTAGLAKAG